MLQQSTLPIMAAVSAGHVDVVDLLLHHQVLTVTQIPRFRPENVRFEVAWVPLTDLDRV